MATNHPLMGRRVMIAHPEPHVRDTLAAVVRAAGATTVLVEAAEGALPPRLDAMLLATETPRRAALALLDGAGACGVRTVVVAAPDGAPVHPFTDYPCVAWPCDDARIVAALLAVLAVRRGGIHWSAG